MELDQDVFDATLGAVLDCMTRRGEVPSTATIADTFGTLGPTGEVIPPPAGVSEVSSECVAGALDLLNEELEGVAAEDVPATYAALPGRIASGEISTPDGEFPPDAATEAEPQDPTIKPSDDVNAAGDTASRPPSPDGQGSCRPKSSDFLWYLNFYSDISISSWKYNSNNETPCFFEWDDDVCTNVPDKGPWFNFVYACKRHDFQYRNLKRAESWYDFDAYRKRNKSVADKQFLRDMQADCRTRPAPLIHVACTDTAHRYYIAVSVVGSNTLGYKSPLTFVR